MENTIANKVKKIQKEASEALRSLFALEQPKNQKEDYPGLEKYEILE